MRWGEKAAALLPKYKEFNFEAAAPEFNADWREFNCESPTPEQVRIANEEESVSAALHGIYALLYSKNSELINSHKTEIIQALEAICWEKLVLATSLTLFIGIHSKGVEYKLWDVDLAEYTLSFNAEIHWLQIFCRMIMMKRMVIKPGI